MQREIDKFKQAQLLLQEAEKDLNKAVMPFFEACKTVDDLNDLIEKLPPGYKAIQRMYYKMELMKEFPDR